MQRIFLYTFLICQPIYAIAEETPVVVWSTPEARQRLMTSVNNDFFQLADRFQPQINPLYCGVASSTIVLNAMRQDSSRAPSQQLLEVKMPKAFGGGAIPFRAYSQLTFLNEQTDKVKNRSVIRLENVTEDNTNDGERFDPGLSLQDLANVLAVYDVDAKLTYAADSSDDAVRNFRDEVIASLRDDESFVICNFYGKAIGQTTGGHISPVAAYHKDSDSLMILDVAGHKNSWYWVDVTRFYRAMHAQDGDHHRGWLIVRDLKK